MPGILQTLATDANLVTSLLPIFLSNLSKNPTVQIIETALLDIAEAITTRQTSFRIANYSITAKLNGSPVAFTVSAAVLGLENVVAGKTGVFTSGDIEIDIQPLANTPPSAPASAPVISAPVAA